MTDSQFGQIQRMRRKCRYLQKLTIRKQASTRRYLHHCKRYIRMINRTGKLNWKFMQTLE